MTRRPAPHAGAAAGRNPSTCGFQQLSELVRRTVARRGDADGAHPGRVRRHARLTGILARLGDRWHLPRGRDPVAADLDGLLRAVPVSDAHRRACDRIQAQVQRAAVEGQKLRISHGNSNSTRNDAKDPGSVVDTRALSSILEINTTQAYVVAEPNVSMAELVAALLPLGYLPFVVPEFPRITIGGAVQGGAAESSSFKYGCVHEACLEYEIVTPVGTKIVTRELDPELFAALPCSLGSLAVLTSVKIPIRPAKPWVNLRYTPVSDNRAAIDAIASAVTTDVDFIDGIMFAPHCGTVMTGAMSDTPLARTARFGRWRDEWFYLHAERTARQGRREESIPTADYLFRYDRGGFWMGRHGFAVFHVPFTRAARTVFARLLSTHVLYAFLRSSGLSQRYLIQDICLPRESAQAFLAYNEARLGIFPVWLCPIAPDAQAFLAPNHLETELVVNVGLWGPVDAGFEEFVALNRDLEAEVSRLRGRKVLYAHAYYEEREFWTIYDRQRYAQARRRTAASRVFPDIFTKCRVDSPYQVSPMRGLAGMLSEGLRRM